MTGCNLKRFQHKWQKNTLKTAGSAFQCWHALGTFVQVFIHHLAMLRIVTRGVFRHCVRGCAQIWNKPLLLSGSCGDCWPCSQTRGTWSSRHLDLPIRYHHPCNNQGNDIKSHPAFTRYNSRGACNSVRVSLRRCAPVLVVVCLLPVYNNIKIFATSISLSHGVSRLLVSALCWLRKSFDGNKSSYFTCDV